MKLLFIGLITMSLSIPVYARNHRECKQLIEKACPGYQKGDKSILKCISENEDKIPEKCRKNKEMKKKSQEQASSFAVSEKANKPDNMSCDQNTSELSPKEMYKMDLRNRLKDHGKPI